MDNLPREASLVLQDYFSLLDEKLPNLLAAFHIFGSIVLGAFDYGFSDIDFTAVLQRQPGESELTILKAIHRTIKRRYPKTDVMGLYISESDLRPEHENQKTCLSFIDGRYRGLVTFDKNSIDAYQLKTYGVTLLGPDIKAASLEPDWSLLIRNMHDNLNTYWRNWLSQGRKLLSLKGLGLLLRTEMVEWCVLGVSRQFYTFRNRDMTSKTGAGEFALTVVPEKWHTILQEAMRLRKGINRSYYHSVWERRKDALDYMEYIIRESNRLFRESSGTPGIQRNA